MEKVEKKTIQILKYTHLLESEINTVFWLRLNSTFINQSNGAPWRISGFWRHSEESKNILYFWESLICLQTKQEPTEMFCKTCKIIFYITDTLHVKFV